LPDLSGVWKLYRGECDFAFLPPPRLRVDTIRQDGERIIIQTRQKDANGTASVERALTIGGDAVEVVIHGRARQVRAFWDADELVVETASEVSGHARRIEDRYRLDADGEWLTIQRVHEQPGGAVRQRLRLKRQSPALI